MFKIGDKVKLKETYFENTGEEHTKKNDESFRIVSIYEGNTNSVRVQFPYFIQNTNPEYEFDMGLVSENEIELVE